MKNLKEALAKAKKNELSGSRDIYGIATDLKALADDFVSRLKDIKRYQASQGQYGPSGEKALVGSFSKVVEELFPEVEILFNRMKNHV